MCSCLRYTFKFKASLLFSITATEQQQKHLQYFHMLLRYFPTTILCFAGA